MNDYAYVDNAFCAVYFACANGGGLQTPAIYLIFTVNSNKCILFYTKSQQEYTYENRVYYYMWWRPNLNAHTID